MNGETLSWTISAQSTKFRRSQAMGGCPKSHLWRDRIGQFQHSEIAYHPACMHRTREMGTKRISCHRRRPNPVRVRCGRNRAVNMPVLGGIEKTKKPGSRAGLSIT